MKAAATAADLLESTRSETVPLLSDDLHRLHGSWSQRSRLGQKLRQKCRSCCRCCCEHGALSALTGQAGRVLGCLVPFYALAASGDYTSKAVVSDLLAGLTMSVFHIPQGLAYGLLAGLRPINGLYTSLIPVALYCLLGRSRHLSLGTFSLTSLLLADMINSTYKQYMDQLPESNATFINCTSMNTEAEAAVLYGLDCASPADGRYFGSLTKEEYARLQVAILGTFAASVINIALGALQLGFVMRYVSNPMLRGFTTAAAVHIFTSQVPMLLGVHPTGGENFFKLIASYAGIINDIGSTNWATVITSVACMVPLYLMKEFLNPKVKQCIRVPLPLELLIILLALAASHALQLKSRFNVDVVGSVPRGLPLPLPPDLPFLPKVLLSCLPVSLVGAAMSLSIVKMYALQFDYEVNYNAELVVLGASSLLGSFFQCFYATGALARCAVVVGAGMRSQLASAVSCIVLLLVVLAVGPLFESVPDCALAAVIVVSLVGLFKQVADVPKLWREARYADLSTWLITALAVLILDVSLGLAVGFCYSLTCTLAARLAASRLFRRRAGANSHSSSSGGGLSRAADQERPDDLSDRFPLMISASTGRTKR